MSADGKFACVFGGDIDQNERFCQCIDIIHDVGLTEPFAVAAVVSTDRCYFCTNQEWRTDMEQDQTAAPATMPAGMNPADAEKEKLPANLRDIPSKTIFKMEEARMYLTSYVDANGRLERKMAFVLPDGRAFTTEKDDLPLTGVTPWFGREIHRNLKEAGVTFVKKGA